VSEQEMQNSPGRAMFPTLWYLLIAMLERRCLWCDVCSLAALNGLRVDIEGEGKPGYPVKLIFRGRMIPDETFGFIPKEQM